MEELPARLATVGEGCLPAAPLSRFIEVRQRGEAWMRGKMPASVTLGMWTTLGPPQGQRVFGLYDVREENLVRRSLEQVGVTDVGIALTRGEMEELGFYACVMDLEDELIRALGSQAVEEVIESEGQLPSFHTLQKQLPWRGQTVEAQLHRFLGSGAYRKIRYARLLVEALELKRVPRPLNQLLARL